MTVHAEEQEGKQAVANTKVTLSVRFKAKSGQEERLKQQLLSQLAPTRAEAGCINYDLHQDPHNPSRFMFYENWTSQEALDQHIQQPYIQAFLTQTEELLAEPLDMTSWKMIG